MKKERDGEREGRKVREGEGTCTYMLSATCLWIVAFAHNCCIQAGLYHLPPLL